MSKMMKDPPINPPPPVLVRIRFIAGQVLPFTCNKCSAKRSGKVYRDLYEWRARLSCGHERRLGYTKPMDVLEELGMINEDLHTFEQEEPVPGIDAQMEIAIWEAKRAKLSTRKSLLY